MQHQLRLNSLWPGLLIFLAASGILICAGIYTSLKTSNFETHASRAAGRVIENVPAMKMGETEANYYPKIEFETARGEGITVILNSGSNSPAFEVGQRVILLYDPQKPTHVEIDNFWSLWLLTMALSGIGAVFALIGGGMLIYEIRRRRRTAVVAA